MGCARNGEVSGSKCKERRECGEMGSVKKEGDGVCPASQAKRRPSASSRTHSDGPVSQTCLLPTLKGES